MLRPITTSDHVAGANGCNPNTTAIEVRLAHRCDNKFGGRFRGAVWVTAAKRIRFPIAPVPFPILITFVRRHRDHRANAVGRSYCLQQRRGPEHVR